LPYYCYAIKFNSRTSCSQVLQLAYADGKAADMSELQTHHCTTPWRWTWFLCTVGVIL